MLGRHKNALLAGAVTFAVLFGGCSAPPKGIAGSSSAATATFSPVDGSTTAVQASPGAAQPTVASATHLHLTNCTRLATGAQYPGLELPADPPWPPVGPGVASEIVLTFAHCQRIGWGPFERGPIDVLTEDFDGYAIPEACKSNHTASKYVTLNAFWISSSEIAGWAKQKFPALPILVGNFSLSSHPVQSGVRWQLTASSGGPSSGFNWTTSEPTHELALTVRFLAANQTRVLAIDLQENYRTDEGLFQPVQTGHAEPPLLYGQSGAPYVGVGSVGDRASSDFSIVEMGGLDCRGP